ncbi:ubiquinone biosynthesis regulatory protein kinase UbiB [Cardiobacteriaceae bacterium TAE3-ERU3]|nr:ubiquinone biosynthesis regulatory protein kinase UbiB [Cardiobacteriaceae bacterium TAE3-ERU3]
MWRSIRRVYAIVTVLIRYRLDDYLPRQGIFRFVRWGVYLHPAYYRRDDIERSLGERLRLTLESLGPIFVKLGQTLSTRPDLLPPDVVIELSRLQDRVPPFPGDQARVIVEAALNEPIDTIFSSFDDQALASASVAQVHAATLHSGEDVVVKVLRPGIERLVAKDIGLMYTIARLAARTRDGKRLRPVEVVQEFENTIANELDLTYEAANASQLRVNFKDSPLLYVPEIYWPYTRSQVMVMERIYAVNIADEATIKAADTNMKELAERGVEIFFTQVFRDSFFHADMHPGNIFVDLNDPDKPQYCAIDFGIMGSLTPEDQHYLAENFLAFFNRDYRRVAELHVESGWVPSTTRVTDFEAAIRKVSEPIFGKPIKDISFGVFLLSLFQTARRFDMEIQPQLVLLQKTFFNVEGLGRRLYPELDLWTTAKPVLEDWMKDQVGPKAMLKRMRYNAHDYAKTLPQLPLLTADAMRAVIDSNRNHIAQRNYPRQQWGMLSGSVLLASSTALALWRDHYHWWQWLLLIALTVLGMRLIFKREK